MARMVASVMAVVAAAGEAKGAAAAAAKAAADIAAQKERAVAMRAPGGALPRAAEKGLMMPGARTYVGMVRVSGAVTVGGASSLDGAVSVGSMAAGPGAAVRADACALTDAVAPPRTLRMSVATVVGVSALSGEECASSTLVMQ